MKNKLKVLLILLTACLVILGCIGVWFWNNPIETKAEKNFSAAIITAEDSITPCTITFNGVYRHWLFGNREPQYSVKDYDTNGLFINEKRALFNASFPENNEFVITIGEDYSIVSFGGLEYFIMYAEKYNPQNNMIITDNTKTDSEYQPCLIVSGVNDKDNAINRLERFRTDAPDKYKEFISKCDAALIEILGIQED